MSGGCALLTPISVDGLCSRPREPNAKSVNRGFEIVEPRDKQRRRWSGLLSVQVHGSNK